MLRDQLAQELAIEAVEVVEGIEHAVSRPHAQEQTDFAKTWLQVDHHGGSLGEARHLDAAVDRHRRRAGAALGAEEDEGGGGRLRTRDRLAAGIEPADGAVEHLVGGRPGEELVGTGAHGLQDHVGIGRRGNGENAGRRCTGLQPLDVGHGRRHFSADVDDHEISHLAFPDLVDDADGNRTGPEHPADAASELFFVRQNLRGELGHGSAPTFRTSVSP